MSAPEGRPYGDLRILVTGSRGPLTRAQATYVETVLFKLAWPAIDQGQTVVVVHGAANGVDRTAARWAQGWLAKGVREEPHPADWEAHRNAAGPLRNQEMVNLGADMCLAFPSASSKGTWDCLRKAADAGIIGHVYPI